jgi:hypothetical protein
VRRRVGGWSQLNLGYVRRLRQRYLNFWWTLVAALVYTLAAVFVTYPLIFHLSSSIAGGGDNYSYSWHFWHVKQVILGFGEGLADIPWLNHPAGLYHPFTLTMLTVLLTPLPLLLVAPPHVIYNLHILVGLVLSGLSTYWFATELTGDRRAGLIGGLAFAYGSNKMGHMMAGHLPQTVVYWVPLFGLLLWRVTWKPGWRNGVVCGLVLVPTLLVHPIHVVYFVLPLALAILLYALVELGKKFFVWKRLRTLVLAFGIAALVVVPVLWSAVAAQREKGYLSAGGTVLYSTDLLALFTPSPFHPVLREIGWLPGYAEDVFPNAHALQEGLAYPGLLVTLLAIWAFVDRWRRSWIWAALASACLILSLGPLLKIGGQLARYTVGPYESHIVLPYALVKPLPVVGVSRTPNRINETASFGLAILAAIGFSALCRRLKKEWASSIFTGVLAIGIVFEMLVLWPLPLREAKIPPVIRSIAAEDGTGAVLHLPPLGSSEFKHLALHYQTVHERPIVGGWVHRPLPSSERWETTLSKLATGDSAAEDIVARPSLSERRAWLRYFDVDYVVMSKAEKKDVVAYRPYLEGLLGTTAHEDSELAAFAVPRQLAPPASDLLYTVTEDWTAPRQGSNGHTWRRWIGDGGSIYVYAARPQSGRITFTVHSEIDLATMELEVDDKEMGTFIVGERSTYVSPSVTWEEGMHTLRFETESGCRQSESGACETLALSDVAFIPESDLPSRDTLDVNLGDLVHLIGYHLDTSALRPSGTLTVSLTWRAVNSLDEDLVVFAHFFDEDGELVVQRDSEPAEGRYPTSAWRKGTVFSHDFALSLPDDLEPGTYHLLTGMYRWPSLERLPVLSDVPGAENSTVELGELELRP